MRSQADFAYRSKRVTLGAAIKARCEASIKSKQTLVIDLANAPKTPLGWPTESSAAVDVVPGTQ